MTQVSALRVLFDPRIFVRQRFGGISRYFASLTQELPCHGIAPHILAPLFVNDYIKALPLRTRWGIPASGGGLGMRVVNGAAMAATPLVARLSGSPVIHETYYSSRGRRPLGVRKVLTVHDMIHELYPGDFAPDDPTRTLKASAIDNADWIVCVSEHTRNDLVRYFPEAADRTSVILHGFETTKAPGSADRETTPYILYVGPRAGYKNFATLLAAFAGSARLRKTFDLLCIGGGPFSAAEVAAIEAGGVTDRVRQVDAHDDELRRSYRDAAVFVYPSRYEGFGIPPLEAMAADCPVVTMPVSSMPEVCGDAADYVEANHPEAMAAAIERVVFDGSHADALRAAGRRRLTLFSWARCAAETAAVYRSLA